ncbi:hypothetical protein GCK32_008941 [Trichostrongylus colubriformis]|uniref:Uncharacterized protein n=1 Tax=Trichostrongylus colubriformis TaxID=6319 RepID=A0AAN8FAG0_TRICO
MYVYRWVLAVFVITPGNNYVDAFAFLPAWPPWQQQIPPNTGFAPCGSSQVATVVLLLRPTPLDITEAKDAMTLWNFESISKTLHDRASQIEGENLFNLFIVERYLPSDEFIEATNALTAIQKGHIGGLFIANRKMELDQIMNGIILSLPDEVQIKARNFMELMEYLLCLHNSLREPPYY